jgi:hypothetical protein
MGGLPRSRIAPVTVRLWRLPHAPLGTVGSEPSARRRFVRSLACLHDALEEPGAEEAPRGPSLAGRPT